MALGEQQAVAKHFGMMHDLDGLVSRDGRPHGQHVVVLSWSLEFAADVDDHEQVTAVLDLAIGNTALTEHFRPAHLKINEVVGMMQKPHAVRLGVSHANSHFMAVTHDRLPWMAWLLPPSCLTRGSAG